MKVTFSMNHNKRFSLIRLAYRDQPLLVSWM